MKTKETEIEKIRIIYRGSDTLYKELYDTNLEIPELEKLTHWDSWHPDFKPKSLTRYKRDYKKALDYRDNLQIVINEVRAAHEKDLWYLHMDM